MWDLLITGEWSSMIIPSMSEMVNGMLPSSRASIIRSLAMSGCVNRSFSSSLVITLLNVGIPGPSHLSATNSLERW